MTAGEERAFLGDFTNRSEAIVDESVVERQWEAFCKYGKRGYLHHLHGKPGFARRLAGKLNLLHHFDSREVQRRRLSLIRCESHREALITVLDRASRGIHNDMGEGRE